MTVDQLLDADPRPSPLVEGYLKGGVMVFCDPFDLPSSAELAEILGTNANFAVAMGIHPSYSSLDICHLLPAMTHISNLATQGSIHAIREIGFDYTKGGSIVYQEALVRQFIPLLEADMPLILHIRGDKQDRNGERAYGRCLAFLREKAPLQQVIQLHSFSGSVNLLRRWLEVFPNTYFSFSGLVKHFGPEQKEALRQVPSNRLMFETDSPYLPLRKSVTQNFPQYIGETLEFAAQIRESTPQLLARANEENIRGAFKL